MTRHVSQWVSSSRDFATRASSRASISTLTRPRRSHSRPSIGRPTDFRHFDGVDGIQSMVNDAPMPIRRRRSFRPLELSIYLPDGCGRLSPLPDFEELEVPAQALVRVRDSRTDSLSSNPSTSTSNSTSYLIQRKAVGSGAASRRSSLQSQKSASTATQERRLSGTTMATMATPTLPLLPEEPPKCSSESFVDRPSIQRSRTSTSGTMSPARVLSRLPSPSRSRASTAPSRPGSLRRAKTDVDDAIRELNTIVEERRASAYRSQTQSPALISRPPPSPSHHVPYIAPSMRMHVRSETLSDIGSAFSAPLSSKPLPNPPTAEKNTPARRATMGLTLSPPVAVARPYTAGPLTSNPITPPAPHTPTTPISRLGAWIKRSTTSITSASRPTTPKTADSQFYKCEPTTAPLPPVSTSSSRPSTAIANNHARQDSQESNGTATVTLFSSSSSSSTRSASPTPTSISSLTTFTNTTSFPSPPRKSAARRQHVPAPLNLAKEKEIAIETALASARSTRSVMNAKPPMSPNLGLLRGMEIVARDVGVNGRGAWDLCRVRGRLVWLFR
ncbi:hypothetical protein N0V83_009284 [Neocucurbitaria cava]|uniref:Uncharacterized protein n=1 Tax=Neocucurbitaria cava TaxID=798079 RepID=A0A9W8Y1L4_9PLEO|nr:hypothetical protein N0V83_009284 [Neocucurbitaria cava]